MEKPTAKKKGPPKVEPTEEVPDAETDDMMETPRKRRQLSRRSSDEQVERALVNTLSHLAEYMWRSQSKARMGCALPST